MFEHLNHINGVEVYPIISLAIFFVFFIGLTIWVVRTKPGYISKMENLPLENDSPDKNTIGDVYEN